MQGVWLPLALAAIEQSLACVISVFAKEGSGYKIPTVADILKSWMLPFLAEAVEADTRESEAERLFESVKNLGKRTGAKIEVS